MANKWVCISQSERDYLFKILGEEKSAKSLMKKLKDVDKTIKVSSRKGKGRNLQQLVS